MHSTLAQPKEPIDVAEAGADAAEDTPPFMKGMPSSVEFNKLRKRLLRQARQAIEDFAMVKPGERWLVALSGGKDSYGLLAVLMELQWRGLLPVEILACNLDQGQPNFPKHILPDYLDSIGIAHRIEYQDTYSVVTGETARIEHLLLALLTLKTRTPLPHRAGGGVLFAGAGGITARTFWKPSS